MHIHLLDKLNAPSTFALVADDVGEARLLFMVSEMERLHREKGKRPGFELLTISKDSSNPDPKLVQSLEFIASSDIGVRLLVDQKQAHKLCAQLYNLQVGSLIELQTTSGPLNISRI